MCLASEHIETHQGSFAPLVTQTNRHMQTEREPESRTKSHGIDLNPIVAGVVSPVCERLGLRQFMKGRNLYAVLNDMTTLRIEHNANLGELMAYGLALFDHARTLCSEKPADRDDARREHLEADTQQDRHRGLMAIDGENPFALEQHAKLLRREAAAAVQLAVEEERRAREIRLNRATARQRIGVA